MQPSLCSKCQKNVAIIFITRLDNDGQSKNEGLCLKCAKELNIKPVTDMIDKMGMSEEDLEGLTKEMMSAFEGAEGMDSLLSNTFGEDPDDNDEGRTATFPFLNKLMGNFGTSNNLSSNRSDDSTAEPPAEVGSRIDRDDKGKKNENKHSKRKFLENYCISLTRRAQEGQLDRVIGRESELERVIQILNRRQKNNPCLIGEPGVGKTAIAEGLASKIQSGDVPYKLRDKEVYLLDLTSLVAGTQFRGQFESRMKGLIEEIRKLGTIILVIDEVHNLVGAGDAEGSMNAANILKPALSRGEIQVIGATTLTEYRKYIEKDSALERRFQPVIVNEPSMEESVEIIKGIAPYYEQFHYVTITPDLARLAVTMSERYITDRFLPDKAIDLIDEACSDVNLKNKSLARLAEIEKELSDLSRERDVMLADDSDAAYARLATIRSRELQLLEEKATLKQLPPPALTLENLSRVIELWTKIPASQIQEQEYERLAHLEERLKQHIIGQSEAIAAVSSAIRRNRVGVASKRKPVSFIFVGSTGVGKTELVKRLSQDLFNSPESLIRLDMSEFMEKHSVSRIIGSPPGYVGYDEAGQLTEKIRRKPYSVILFDEIEKAHPDVLNVLLQILDDGHITDAQGRVVNFENTVIVMTSNAGSDRKTGALGFGRTSNEQGKERATKALQEFLRPEFINRVDEVIYFNQLTEEHFRDIAIIMLSELRD
ncbi:MAG: ClpB protein, partial [Evtepia sp.]|nr:ClpB protein [Evtepia sp.]